MTLTPPSTPPTVAPVTVDVPSSIFRGSTDVQPFTYRSGMTYTALLESMRVWLRNTLVPYLNTNFEDLAGSWQDNVTALANAVDAALAQQTTDNTNAINTALQEIANSSVTITDPAMLAALEAAGSATLAYLDGRYNANAVTDQHVKDVISNQGTSGITYAYLATLFADKPTQDQQKVYWAPAPQGLDGNGNPIDDTSVLQALVNAAQSTNGTVVLQHGTYHANLATSQSFAQPRIVGQGRDQTTVQAFVNTSPVIRMKGGSGKLSGGYLADLTILAAVAGGGVGLQLADCNGVSWERLRFDAPSGLTLAEGIQFVNESAGAFTEFCSGDADIRSTVVLPVHYAKVSGGESFHGTGLRKGSLINQSTTALATQPLIQIDQGCFPYAAPMDVTIFPKVSNTQVFSNRDTGRISSFQGNMDIEVQSGATGVTLGDMGTSPATNPIVYEGNLNALISGSGLLLGNLLLAEKVYYQGGTTVIQRRPWQETTNLGTGTTALTKDHTGACLMHVEIVAANYDYEYTLLCSQDTYSSTAGSVVIAATHKSLNTAGYGAPTFGWGSQVPTITNPNYPATGVVAYVDIIPFSHNRSADRLAQH